MSKHKESKPKHVPKQDATPSLEEELANVKEQQKRLLAEYANFKRRTDEERNHVYDSGVSDVLSEVVKVLDNFELALASANDLASFKQGMEMIFANIISAGEEFGLERIKTEGEQFNPTQHEALMAEESKQKPQTILAELQSGYMVKGKVIRTAKVKVSK